MDRLPRVRTGGETMINMSKHYELRNEEADRRLFNMESDIETVALALILAVVV